MVREMIEICMKVFVRCEQLDDATGNKGMTVERTVRLKHTDLNNFPNGIKVSFFR